MIALAGLLLQFLRELHFIEATRARTRDGSRSGCSSSGNCTSLRQVLNDFPLDRLRRLQFLRELHLIEARSSSRGLTSGPLLQFLRELHFIEARCR